MNTQQLRRLTAVAMATAGVSLAALADNVRVLDEGPSLTASIFPSDRFSVPDFTQRSFRRVNLPKPDCAVRPSDCADIDVINQLDGFSTQPRITVPFSGAIDLGSVSSSTVYLINLGDPLTLRGAGERVGINQVVWEPATQTLSFESDQLLQEHSRYLLVVTDGVRDSRGKPIKKPSDDAAMAHPSAYQRELHAAGLMGHRGGQHKVVAASLFTTQSATTDLLKIMGQVKAGTPAPASFMIGNSAGDTVRAVFPLASLQGIQFVRQTGAAPAFTPSFLPTPALNVIPGAVAAVAYGRYQSPNYLSPLRDIPPTPTWTGQPQALGSHQLVFQLIVPAGVKPAAGWPVAIFGHGFGDSMYGAPLTVAATFASQGIATLSINVVGHGGGDLGTLNVLRPGMAPVVVPAGGRGFDQDGNGAIASTEGSSAAPPRAVIGSRDALRQTVVDIMQLVRQVQAGIDFDGDGSVDLDAANIHYSGQSFGGIYGTMLLGTEPHIVSGVPNVPGGSITEIVRLSPVFRGLAGFALATRTPSLINVSGIDFNENMPLRNQPPLINTVAGAAEIAKVLDRQEWVQQSGNPVSYAPLVRKQPPAGHAAKPVIIQFAWGDKTVPNPTTSAIVRSGDLADRTTLFRNDLAYAANNAVGTNPHTFLTSIGNPAAAGYALAAQMQIATFFKSRGMLTIDPDGAAPIFEVPIARPLPEGTNFIP